MPFFCVLFDVMIEMMNDRLLTIPVGHNNFKDDRLSK